MIEKESGMVLMTVGWSKTIKSNIWIADSAALTHITYSGEGLYDYRVIQEPIKIGDSKLVYATKVGKLKVFYEKEDREQVKFILKNIQYIPNFWVNCSALLQLCQKTVW